MATLQKSTCASVFSHKNFCLYNKQIFHIQSTLFDFIVFKTKSHNFSVFLSLSLSQNNNQTVNIPVVVWFFGPVCDLNNNGKKRGGYNPPEWNGRGGKSRLVSWLHLQAITSSCVFTCVHPTCCILKRREKKENKCLHNWQRWFYFVDYIVWQMLSLIAD